MQTKRPAPARGRPFCVSALAPHGRSAIATLAGPFRYSSSIFVPNALTKNRGIRYRWDGRTVRERPAGRDDTHGNVRSAAGRNGGAGSGATVDASASGLRAVLLLG